MTATNPSSKAPTPRKVLKFKFPLKTEYEVDMFLAAAWGVRLPAKKVCKNHVAPRDAFMNAYFARDPLSMWIGSRGFGGKTFTLGTLSNLEAVSLGVDVSIIGGSEDQSMRVIETANRLWSHRRAPTHLLFNRQLPSKRTTFNNGAKIFALPASSKAARGRHSPRLRLDEADEMKLSLVDSAFGQPMSRGGVKPQILISSTHHYPDGTVTELKRRAKEKGFPIFQWCWRETIATNGGWLNPEDIESKRRVVTAAMWDTEYELQEPSSTDRAMVTKKVNAMFDVELGDFPGDEGVEIILEGPRADARYATGIDWAKSSDWTIITTFRTDVSPWRMVAWLRLGRRPYPEMVKRAEKRVKRYPGPACHDATGIGGVIEDYQTADIQPFIMVGRERHNLFTEYIADIEDGILMESRGRFHAPMIRWAYEEHLYASRDSLYGTGHPPDTVVSGALARHAGHHGRFSGGIA